jgi:hypothetical protein
MEPSGRYNDRVAGSRLGGLGRSLLFGGKRGCREVLVDLGVVEERLYAEHPDRQINENCC